MYTLYVKEGCPFCHRVLSWAAEHSVELNTKNISDDGVSEELISRGGKRVVPYLVDESNQVEMYESLDIIAYLEEQNK